MSKAINFSVPTLHILAERIAVVSVDVETVRYPSVRWQPRPEAQHREQLVAVVITDDLAHRVDGHLVLVGAVAVPYEREYELSLWSLTQRLRIYDNSVDHLYWHIGLYIDILGDRQTRKMNAPQASVVPFFFSCVNENSLTCSAATWHLSAPH